MSTREQWLNSAVAALKASFFEPAALAFKTPVRISFGWCRGSNKAIGQCWSHVSSADGHTEIFISPKLGDAVEVLAVTLHELIHAQLGNGKGHGKEFKALCNKFGLAGKVTATYAQKGSELDNRLVAIAAELGAMPHAQLTPMDAKGGEKKERVQKSWPRFKSVNFDDYRVMVSPRSLRDFGVPLDPKGTALVLIEKEDE